MNLFDYKTTRGTTRYHYLIYWEYREWIEFFKKNERRQFLQKLEKKRNSSKQDSTFSSVKSFTIRDGGTTKTLHFILTINKQQTKLY